MLLLFLAQKPTLPHPQQPAHAEHDRAPEEITMGRSIKKGPFVDAHLMAKINVMQEKNDKRVAKTYLVKENLTLVTTPPAGGGQ